jgi:glycosyltransferase involved in cell wall biosynthesis
VNLHTAVVSFERLALLKRTIQSYLATVTVPWRLVVVDNGSSHDVRRWLDTNIAPENLLMLGENRYPGYACNRAFELAADDVTHLHRSDSDMEYLPGWCDHAIAAFESGAGIVGLRTDAEELYTELNTGGTAIIRRELWAEGLRYHEGEWVNDMTEDWKLCQDAKTRGWRWTRVAEPSVVHLGGQEASIDDPYYRHSFGVRGLTHLL